MSGAGVGCRCRMPGAICRMPVAGAGCRCYSCRVPGAGCRCAGGSMDAGAGCRYRMPVPGTGCPMPGTGCRMPDAGAGGARWAGAGCRCRMPVPDAGCRCRIPVAGKQKMYIMQQPVPCFSFGHLSLTCCHLPQKRCLKDSDPGHAKNSGSGLIHLFIWSIIWFLFHLFQ